jgi:RNA polymerase sigma-70 factor (ECF subfamily)
MNERSRWMPGFLGRAAEPSLETEDDLRLARAALEGDERAQRQLFEAILDPVHRFVSFQLQSSPEDAEEVVQDTLVGVFRSLGKYKGDSKLTSWAVGIARHKVVDFRRKAGRSRQVVPLSEFEEVDLEGRLEDSDPLPEEAIVAAEHAGRLRQLLHDLPPQYSEVLLLRYDLELSVPEVAQLIGKNVKATESLLVRARNALRRDLRRVTEEAEHV